MEWIILISFAVGLFSSLAAFAKLWDLYVWHGRHAYYKGKQDGLFRATQVIEKYNPGIYSKGH